MGGVHTFTLSQTLQVVSKRGTSCQGPGLLEAHRLTGCSRTKCFYLHGEAALHIPDLTLPSWFRSMFGERDQNFGGVPGGGDISTRSEATFEAGS